MEYRRLGNSDLEISTIGLGSWLTYGAAVDNRLAQGCLAAAFDAGINFIDTANVYGRGAAEQFLGQELSGRPRDSYILATKVFFPMSDHDRGLSAEQIATQIDASLRRLRTDYVDLYQCHRYDPDTPLEETMKALDQVVRSGKARYIGFSEWTAGQIKAAQALSDLTPFVSSQPQYSLLWRRPEAEVIPLCRETGIGQVVWSPLAQGVLTGKYAPGKRPPADSRAASDKMGGFMSELCTDTVLSAVQQLKPLADAAGLSMAQLSLAWVLRDKAVSSAIIGATRPEQVHDNAAAAGVTLDDALLADIDKVLEPAIRR